MEEQEFQIGVISSAITVTARLRFDPPTETQNGSGSSDTGRPLSTDQLLDTLSNPGSVSGSSNTSVGGGFATSNASGRITSDGGGGTAGFNLGGGLIQVQNSGALTKTGGLSGGSGVRVGDGNKLGFSSVGTGTINKDGYQGAAGFSAGGLSANAKLQVGRGGVSLSGGIQRSTVGQGIVGPYVGGGR